jgi:hypothetical protein
MPKMNYGTDEHGEWLEPERLDGKPRAYRPYEAKSLEQLAKELGYKDINDLQAHSLSGAELLEDSFQRLKKPSHNAGK